MRMDEITEEMGAGRDEVQGLGLESSSVEEMSKNKQLRVRTGPGEEEPGDVRASGSHVKDARQPRMEPVGTADQSRGC